MHYKLRRFLISAFKANKVPIIKKALMAIQYVCILKGAIYTTEKIMDFW